jgi:lincosamide nucleotidyltransferase B/F
MTDRKTLLLRRLDEIGQALAETGEGLALLGLGSVGAELERLDEYSDLDFFAIVKDGCKPRFLSNTDWLNRPCPVVYLFANTVDGFKYLYDDGIFCEMAVFEPHELVAIPFAAGRIVWRDPAFNTALLNPTTLQREARPAEWLLGEALTNLYVGLGRYHRGEKLSAQRFIQHYAVDRVLELAPYTAHAENIPADAFTPERRFEARYPALAAHLPDFVQGYNGSIASARAILSFLDAHFQVNPAIKRAIEELSNED